MTIKELCYELYKIDWESIHHIKPKRKMENLKVFYEENKINHYPYSSYKEYLMEVGYNGEIYACFDEFLNNEYQDEGYIMALLDNEELFEEYLRYV